MKNLLKMLGNVFCAAPVHAVFGVFTEILCALQAVLAAAYLPNFLYDAIIGTVPWEKIVVTLLGIGAVTLAYNLCRSLYKCVVIPGLEVRLYERMQKPVFDKSLHLDAQQYDDAEFYNDYRWVISDARARRDELISLLEIDKLDF